MRAAQDSGQTVTQEQDEMASQACFYVAQSSRRRLKELGRTGTIENIHITLELPAQEVSKTEGHRTRQEIGKPGPLGILETGLLHLNHCFPSC